MLNTAWTPVETDTLDNGHLDALFTNRIAAVRIPDVISRADCERSVASMYDHGFTYYQEVDPPVGKIGITLIENLGEPQAYFDAAPAAKHVRRGIFSTGQDPVDAVLRTLGAATDRGSRVRVATDAAVSEYFAGVIRLMAGGARIHSDWAPRDAAGWTVANINAQLAWNIYYSLPDNGGQTIVYQQPWTTALEQFANSDGYGYSESAVSSAVQCVIRPRVGELVIFNPRNMHSVVESTGATGRISVSSFIGRDPRGDLILWS